MFFGSWRIIPIFLSFIIIFILKIILNEVYLRSKSLNDCKSPLTNTQAKVLTRRCTIEPSPYTSHNVETYFITFKLPNGQTMEFRVKREDYICIPEQGEGYLTYQGAHFKKFKCNS